jgi:hypothetical protein
MRSTRYFAMANKASFVASLIVKMLAQVTVVTVIGLGGLFAYQYVNHIPFDTARALRQVILHPIFLAFIALTSIRMVRRALFRLYDSDWD